MVLEVRRTVPGALGLCDPELDGVQLAHLEAGVLLGMGDAVSGRHDVQLPGPDELLGAEAVAVEQFPGDDPGHGLQAHVGVGPDADRTGLTHRNGADVVREAPGTDRSPRSLRQHSAHGKRTDLRRPRPGSSDTTGPVAGAGAAGAGGVSSVATGPLMAFLIHP